MSVDDREKFIQEYTKFYWALVAVPKVYSWTPYSITSLMETRYTSDNSASGADRARRVIKQHAMRFEDAAWEDLKSLKSTEFSSLQIVKRIRMYARGRDSYASLLNDLTDLEVMARNMHESFEDLCSEADGFDF